MLPAMMLPMFHIDAMPRLRFDDAAEYEPPDARC